MIFQKRETHTMWGDYPQEIKTVYWFLCIPIYYRLVKFKHPGDGR